jgi:hypothetical protein
LISQRLKADTHLLKLLVGGICCVPVRQDVHVAASSLMNNQRRAIRHIKRSISWEPGVPGVVEVDRNPWCCRAIYVRQVSSKPLLLWAAQAEKNVSLTRYAHCFFQPAYWHVITLHIVSPPHAPEVSVVDVV